MNDVIQRMFEAGVHFGFSKTRNHPSTQRAIFGFKNRQAIIDLQKTRDLLEKAKDFLKSLGAAGKIVMLVGNKEEIQKTIKELAESYGLPYTASRWLGGTLTNFSQLKTRIDRLKDLQAKKAEGKLLASSKKELARLNKEIERLERYFSSFQSLEKLPAALIAVDSDYETIAVSEAKKTGVATICVSGTDCDIRGLDYPIIANDASVESVRLLLGELLLAYDEGRKSATGAVE